MRIVHSIEHPLTDTRTLLTIGKFDGVHLGHQLLIRTATDRARQCGCASAVLTFEPHPGLVIRPERELRLLTSLDERIELISCYDPHVLIIAPFTHEVMNTTAYEYMSQLCSIMPLCELWTGSNFALGRDREGDIQRLMEIGDQLGYAVGSVAPMLVEGAPISSSRVRNLLRDGIVEGIDILLGRPFSIRGVVVEGDHRGRTIGFPTANVQLNDPLHAVPANGVYVCRAYVEDIAKPAVVNIGVRPTFDGHHQTIEAHILDWSGTIYGKTMRLAFLHRLRGEQRFRGTDDLVAQITRDVAQARDVLKKLQGSRI